MPPRTPSDKNAATDPSPVTMALSQYGFREKLRKYVLEVRPEERKRALFTVVFVQNSKGLPTIDVSYVPEKEAESGRDTYVNAFFVCQPSLRNWLRSYDPKTEFLIAAACCFAGTADGDTEQLAQQPSQAAKIPFAGLSEIDDAFSSIG